MKKLTYLASAIAASFGQQMQYADVSVSGSGNSWLMLTTLLVTVTLVYW